MPSQQERTRRCWWRRSPDRRWRWRCCGSQTTRGNADDIAAREHKEMLVISQPERTRRCWWRCRQNSRRGADVVAVSRQGVLVMSQPERTRR